jgi:hypothetical protein
MRTTRGTPIAHRAGDTHAIDSLKENELGSIEETARGNDAAGSAPGDRKASGADLIRRAKAIEAAGVHRRHEELLEIAVTEDGIPRPLAEQVHELAHEEGLAPAYALALVATGIGVEDLVPPESGDNESLQQSLPGWVEATDMSQASIVRERHLRASFRRLRAHLDRAGSAEAGVRAFLEEPDVGPITY